MDLRKRVIIGIKGRKGSGKDTIASMIHYIMSVGPSYATYDGWEFANKQEKDELDVPTLHFADKIKNDLSELFGINRECFDSHEYKDSKYYLFQNKSFVTSKEQTENPRPEITLDDLKENTLAYWRERFNDNCVIKLRTLMQYYGTELMRHNIGSNVWINYVINKAIKYKNYYGYAVIADVRFQNEASAIYEVNGRCIYINKYSKDTVEHSSEEIHVNNNDYHIDNNGTLLGLFYKVLEFVKSEM